MAWKIVGEPREFETTEVAAGHARGWAWSIESHGVRRTINVAIADSAAGDYDVVAAEEAVRDVLGEDDPPARLTLTAHGIERG
jgi:hypothetical protein